MKTLSKDEISYRNVCARLAIIAAVFAALAGLIAIDTTSALLVAGFSLLALAMVVYARKDRWYVAIWIFISVAWLIGAYNRHLAGH